MFGGTNEQSNVSLKPGINSGLKMTSFFTKKDGVGKTSGQPYTAYELEFTNGISIRQWYFVPRKQTTPSNNDAQYLSEYNAKQSAKDSNFTPLTMDGWLERRFNNACIDFNALLNMVAYSYIPFGSPELAQKKEQLPQYEDAAAFIADLDNYIAQLKTLFLPEDFDTKDWDVILGKKEGEQYLGMPEKMYMTGRFAKLSTDETRELDISDRWDTNYIEPHLTNSEIAQNTGTGASGYDWTGGAE